MKGDSRERVYRMVDQIDRGDMDVEAEMERACRRVLDLAGAAHESAHVTPEVARRLHPMYDAAICYLRAMGELRMQRDVRNANLAARNAERIKANVAEEGHAPSSHDCLTRDV